MDRVEAVQAEYGAARAEMEKEAVRAAKLEQRLNVLTGGYAAREASLRAGIEEAWAAERAAQQARCLPCLHFVVLRIKGPCDSICN